MFEFESLISPDSSDEDDESSEDEIPDDYDYWADCEALIYLMSFAFIGIFFELCFASSLILDYFGLSLRAFRFDFF